MDEQFRFFYHDKGFGPAEHVQPVSPATLERYRSVLPARLMQYWKEYGFCSYGRGLFWTVDPAEYAPLLPLWLQGTPLFSSDHYAVIGRSAFGEMFLWGAKSGQSIRIRSLRGMIFPRDQTSQIAAGKGDLLAQAFFSVRKKNDLDQDDEAGQPLFERALQSLGQLQADEMYGFEPALALGAKAELDNLRKVKIIPHLTLLAQLNERQLMRDIVQDARGLGLMK